MAPKLILIVLKSISIGLPASNGLCVMDSTPLPYLFSEEHFDSLNKQDTIPEFNVTRKIKENFVHQIHFCLFAPRNIGITPPWTVWKFRIMFRVLILTMLISFVFSRRLFPLRKLPRLSDMLLYMVGLGGRSPLISGRMRFILLLFAIGFHSLMNLLVAQNTAYRTVVYHAEEFDKVQNALDAGLLVKAHPLLQPWLSMVDARVLTRIKFENYPKVDMKIKNFAYLIGCDMAMQLYRTPDNYDPVTEQLRMAPIKEVVLTIAIHMEVPLNYPETGLMEHGNRNTVETYRRTYVSKSNGSQSSIRYAIFGDHFPTFAILTILHCVAAITFLVECLAYKVQMRKKLRRQGPLKTRIARSKSYPAITIKRTKCVCGYKTA